MINWQALTSEQDLQELIQRSYEQPCVIFKHSTTCPISSMAKYRLEDDWSFSGETLQPFYLDLLRYRPLSAAIADTFSVHHESPQVLIVHHGECVYDESHLDISVKELEEALPA